MHSLHSTGASIGPFVGFWCFPQLGIGAGLVKIPRGENCENPATIRKRSEEAANIFTLPAPTAILGTAGANA